MFSILVVAVSFWNMTSFNFWRIDRKLILLCNEYAIWKTTCNGPDFTYHSDVCRSVSMFYTIF
jgi:hypothetical protein